MPYQQEREPGARRCHPHRENPEHGITECLRLSGAKFLAAAEVRQSFGELPLIDKDQPEIAVGLG